MSNPEINVEATERTTRLRRSRARAASIVIGMVLLVVLALGSASADGQCEDNYNHPPPPPKPHGLVQRVMWKQASLYARTEYSGGKLHYQYCHPWDHGKD